MICEFKFLLFYVGCRFFGGVGLFFLIVLGPVSVHTAHSFVGIILNLSSLEYKCSISQNVLQIETALFNCRSYDGLMEVQNNKMSLKAKGFFSVP